MTKEKLTLNKRFLIIDSPISFTLIANEGTDNVYRPAGAWQLNIWELLPERFFKQYPVFNLEIVYDETELKEGEKVVIRESDINLGTGLAGVNGQLVQVENEIVVKNIPLIQTVEQNQKLLNFTGKLQEFFDYFRSSENENMIFFPSDLSNKISIFLNRGIHSFYMCDNRVCSVTNTTQKFVELSYGILFNRANFTLTIQYNNEGVLNFLPQFRFQLVLIDH